MALTSTLSPKQTLLLSGLAVAFVLLRLPIVCLLCWFNCRWLEFDGHRLRGRRFWPFGSFDIPIESVTEVSAQLHHYGQEPKAYYVRWGKRGGVSLASDMTHSAELLAALKQTLANRVQAV